MRLKALKKVLGGGPGSSATVGGDVDSYKAIGKLFKPEGGWTLPGHKYTRPYNDLDNQVRCDPNTGETFEIYDPPTRKTGCYLYAARC